MSEVHTHSLGVKCQRCKETLLEVKCPCGADHGYTFQRPDGWMKSKWPNHQCVRHIKRERG